MASRRSLLAAVGSMPVAALLADEPSRRGTNRAADGSPEAFRAEVERLLADWGDGLVRRQIDAPHDAARHGGLDCPACGRIHGRVIDAIYPLVCLASRTGDDRYLAAALALDAWAANVEGPDGTWLNEPQPGSWKGTTVFHAIARIDTIRHHAAVLGAARVASWKDRLRQAGRFIATTIDYGRQNVNYALTAPLALRLLGELLAEPDWSERAAALAARAGAFRTQPHGLLYGEGRPYEAITAKGCRPVDLGYNVEESLPALLRYAHAAGDRETERLAIESLAAHLAFMLPDGGWDNGWGTRSFKWTWWGSRTSDGCLAALVTGANARPEFATAAVRHLELLRNCTSDGLLGGGLHLAAHGVAPCIHHTVTHAKVLAEILDDDLALPAAGGPGRLPRETAAGVHAYPEIGCLQVAQGPWRATVSGYDVVYPGDITTATGGTLPVVWHERAGVVCVASPPRLTPVEPFNMCRNPPGEEQPLSVRVEAWVEGRWLTNLFDRAAVIDHRAIDGGLEVRVATRLADERGGDPQPDAVPITLRYRWTGGTFTIAADADTVLPWRLVVPVVSPRGEDVRRQGESRYGIAKGGGWLVAEAVTGSLDLPDDAARRTFNMVPGCAAVVIGCRPREGHAAAALAFEG